MKLSQIIEETNIIQKLIDSHYAVNTEYKNTDDIDDKEEIVFFIYEDLDNQYGEDEKHEKLAEEIYDAIYDALIERIYELDEEAEEYESAKRSAIYK